MWSSWCYENLKRRVKYSENPTPVSFCPPEIRFDLAWGRTRAAAVENRRITPRTMGWHAFEYYPPIHPYFELPSLTSYVILTRTSDCCHFERCSSGHWVKQYYFILLQCSFCWKQFISSGYASRNFDIRELSFLHMSPAFVGFHKHSVMLFTGSSIHKKGQLCESVCNTRGNEKNVSFWCHTTVLSVGFFPKVANEALVSWPWVFLDAV
jgi:hypothetical protein